MNLVRKLVYVTLVMPVVYSAIAIDSHESGVRRQRGTELVSDVLDESHTLIRTKGHTNKILQNMSIKKNKL